MAEIKPFRSMTYNPAKVGDLSLVVAHPYDMKDVARVKQLRSGHQHNIAKILWGEVCETNGWDYNRFTRGGELLKEWHKAGVFSESNEPVIFAYNTLFSLRGRIKERKGFVALGKLEEFGKGKIYPHEKTIPKIKEELLNLMRATKTDFGPAFMLYTDRDFRVNKTLQPETTRPPDMELTDQFGVIHRLWRIADKKVIDRVAQQMKDTELFIADGHHRYETALRFRDEARQAGLEYEGCEGYDYILMKFVNIDDPALAILPFHRAIRMLGGFDVDDVLSKLSSRFHLTEYPFRGQEEKLRAKVELLEDLHIEGMRTTVFGVAAAGKECYYLLRLRDSDFMDSFIKEERCREWKRLDVTILHKVVLRSMLGISEMEEPDTVDYVRDAERVLDLVEEGSHKMVFILNPAKIEQLKAVASRFEAMPEKTTDFFPKPLIGLVMVRWRMK